MENVNKQLLDALRIARKKLEDEGYFPVEEIDLAIAAAEQAQQVGQKPVATVTMLNPNGLFATLLIERGANLKNGDELYAAPPAKQHAEPVAWRLFKQALFVGMERACVHYLMANAHGRRDGALKAHNHEHLCRHIVAAVRGCDPDWVRREYEDDYNAIHDGTQALTSYLDEEIGFPLDSRPDYEVLTPKFFDKFFELAMAALGVSPAAQPPAVAVPELRQVRRAQDGMPSANYAEGFDHGWNDCVYQMRAMLAAATEQPK